MYTAEPTLRRSQVRLDRVARTLKLRQEGLSYREIAADVGVSVSTVGGYLADRDGSKAQARKARYRGICVSCGAETNRGRRPRAGEALRCAACRSTASQRWTPERIIAAMMTWHDLTGEWPNTYDWTTSTKTRARRLTSTRPKTRERALHREELLNAGDYPDPAIVRRRFETMAQAVAAAQATAAAAPETT